MSKDLERAFAEASKLPEREQDAVAQWILAELASERAWNEAFAGSRAKLGELGAEASHEQRAGKTERLDPGKL